jgi:ATP-dependent DNA ligase
MLGGTPSKSVVVKDRAHGYGPGRRSWMKVRTRTTAEAIVGGVFGPLNAPESLLLGRHDERGRLQVAGRTGPLTLPARRELWAVLTASRGAHPWPEQFPSSRFGQLLPLPVDYTPAEPEVVVEVDADVCVEQDQWRHATVFRRLRLDLSPDDVTG